MILYVYQKLIILKSARFLVYFRLFQVHLTFLLLFLVSVAIVPIIGTNTQVSQIIINVIIFFPSLIRF